MPTLHNTLWNLAVDDLRYRLRFLTHGSKATRKADLVDGIKAALDGTRLLVALNELDETGRLAVMEAVHSLDNRHSPIRFRSKYGRDAVFFVPVDLSRYSSKHSQTPANSARLNIFFSRLPDGSDCFMPLVSSTSLTWHLTVCGRWISGAWMITCGFPAMMDCKRSASICWVLMC
jgi:hypothetical protein